MSITIKNILAFTYFLSNTDKKSIYKYHIYNLIKSKIYFEFTSLYCYIIKINNLYVRPFKIELD